MPRKRKTAAPGASGPPGSGAPGSGAPKSGAPGSGAPKSGAPGSGAPKSGAPESGASGSGAPGSASLTASSSNTPPPPVAGGPLPLGREPPSKSVAPAAKPPPAQATAPAGPPARGRQQGLAELDEEAWREAERQEMIALLENIKQYGWSLPPAPTYNVPDWIEKDGHGPLPAWMFAPNGYLTFDPTYNPWPNNDYVAGDCYEMSWTGPDKFPAESGGGGGYGQGGGYGGGGYEGGSRGGGRGGGRGGRGGGRGVCNSMRDRGTCRFGAECQFSHDVSSDAGRGRGGRGGRGRGW